MPRGGIYSQQVYNRLRVELKPEILQAVESSPELRNEIRRVFQQANRRIQNIENSGRVSPALQALHKEKITGYTKFAMRGNWQQLKSEYSKAVMFLRQPTSTAQGAQQYGKHIQQTYGLSDKEFKLMSDKLNNKILSISDNDFVEKYLMRYKDFTGELEQAAQDASSQIESDAANLQNAIDNAIDTAADNAAREISDIVADIEQSFNDFGLT